MLFLSQVYGSYLFFMGVYIIVLHIGKANSQTLLEVIKVLWLLCLHYSCQSTDHPGWLPLRLSRGEKFRMWLLLDEGWCTPLPLCPYLSLTSQQQGLHPLSPSLCYALPVPWTLEDQNLIFDLNDLKFRLNDGSVLSILTGSTGCKKPDHLIFTVRQSDP